MPRDLQEFRQELVVRIEHMKVGGEEWPEVKTKACQGNSRGNSERRGWKETLPESYASAQDRRATYAYEFLENRLLLPLNDNEPLRRIDVAAR